MALSLTPLERTALRSLAAKWGRDRLGRPRGDRASRLEAVRIVVEAGGNDADAARLLDLSVYTVHKLRQELGLKSPGKHPKPHGELSVKRKQAVRGCTCEGCSALRLKIALREAAQREFDRSLSPKTEAQARWTVADDDLVITRGGLGALSDHQIARRLGRTIAAVRARRVVLGQAGRPGVAERIKELAEQGVPQKEIARRLGYSTALVSYVVVRDGLPKREGTLMSGSRPGRRPNGARRGATMTPGDQEAA